MIGLRRRRLGDIDRVRPRKGLFQPLLQGVVQPALFGRLFGLFASFGIRNLSGHGMSFRLFRGSDLADGPTMLDYGTVKKYKQEIQARNPRRAGMSMKHITCIEELRR